MLADRLSQAAAPLASRRAPGPPCAADSGAVDQRAHRWPARGAPVACYAIFEKVQFHYYWESNMLGASLGQFTWS
jgi:hypothetical protein